MSTTLIETRNLVAKGSKGRTLFQDLNLSLAKDRVALVGRNGVGKSTLLRLLARESNPHRGVVDVKASFYHVPQTVTVPTYQDFVGIPDLEEEFQDAGLPLLPEGRFVSNFSCGEKRKLNLILAKRSGAEFLLLDEPTEDLDEGGIQWLRSWLSAWEGGLLVATHNRTLLSDFEHFFLVSESGCRCISGSYAELESQLEEEHTHNELRYSRNLNRLRQIEEKTHRVARRRARKEQYGRCREIDRASPKSTLNTKRSAAQVSHGRDKKRREAKLEVLRDWTRSTRKALKVKLPLILPEIELSKSPEPVITLVKVAAEIPDRCLFSELTLNIKDQRIAVVGPNGAGKSTLLEVMLGHRQPDQGRVRVDQNRVGFISQGGANWCLGESLLSYLWRNADSGTLEDIAGQLVSHKFPLALAERKMSSLSPGERVRAALIAIFQREPVPELLLLDEPTYSLDLVGQRALALALRTWPGGLVVVSHDRLFLEEIEVDQYVEL